MEKTKKIIKIILFVFLGIFALLFIFANIYFKFPVRDYYQYSDKAFRIPYISRGFIAQGISYDESESNFYITGYMKNNSASPIFVVNKDSRKLTKTVFMANSDNSPLVCHAGGLSVYGDKIYVAGGENCCLYEFNKSDITNAKNKGSVVCKNIIQLNTDSDGIGVAFTCTNKKMFYAGEFYRLPNYPTYESHTVKCSDGTENHALMVGFKVNGSSFKPTVVYSIPGLVQGVCFHNGKIYVSTSYAVASSHIYIYDESKLKQRGTINCLGKKLPLYVLDSESLCNTKTIPPMSEEIVCVDDEFYIMCESASNKYIFGKFIGAQSCYKSKF